MQFESGLTNGGSGQSAARLAAEPGRYVPKSDSKYWRLRSSVWMVSVFAVQ
jgi:hypothetical protein